MRLTSEGSFHGVGTSIEGLRGLKGIDDALNLAQRLLKGGGRGLGSADDLA